MTKPETESSRAMRGALQDFIETVEYTGGVLVDARGTIRLVDDPYWTDLADAYLRACRALDKEPMISKGE